MSNMKMEVFDKDFNRINVLNSYSSIRYTDMYSDVGSFELQCPITEYNVSLLLGEKDRILWIEDDVAGIIQYSKRDEDEDSLIMTIKGSLLSCMLSWRVILPQVNITAVPDSVIKNLVTTNCISPSDQNRIIPHLELLQQSPLLTEPIVYQQTGSTVSAESTSIAEAYGLGYTISFMPRDTKYLFKILKGLDRTVENTQGLNPVVFSTELNNIISSTYTNNRESFSNVAVVAGEGEGSSRVHYSVNPTEQGYSRRELYVDARDLQSSYYDSATSQTVTLPQAEYEKLLLERGKEKLKDVAEVESFEGKLRNDDGSMFIYKRDYFKGDIVTVIDRLLNVKLSARVTAVTITNDRNGYTVEPTFGYSQPTIIQRLKRKGVF